jgi:protein-disulfide isomerase
MTGIPPRPDRDQVRRLVERRRRRRRAAVTAAAFAVIAGAGAAGAAVTLAQEEARVTTPVVPASSDADGVGLVVSSGPVRVEVYLDYLCPSCGAVEEAVAADLADLAEQGRVELVYHPLGHLDDRSDPPGYSTRAAAAAACAADADADDFRAATAAFFAAQPAAGAPGHTREDLLAIARSAGVNSPAYADCVRDGRYEAWVGDTTAVAYARDVVGTPTVLVAGEPVDVTPSRVAAEVVAAVDRASP